MFEDILKAMLDESESAIPYIKPHKNTIYEYDEKTKTYEITIWAYKSFDDYKEDKMPRVIVIVYLEKKALLNKTKIEYKNEYAKNDPRIKEIIKICIEELKKAP